MLRFVEGLLRFVVVKGVLYHMLDTDIQPVHRDLGSPMTAWQRPCLWCVAAARLLKKQKNKEQTNKHFRRRERRRLSGSVCARPRTLNDQGAGDRLGASTTCWKGPAAVPGATTGIPSVASQTKQNKTKHARAQACPAQSRRRGAAKTRRERRRHREIDDAGFCSCPVHARTHARLRSL